MVVSWARVAVEMGEVARFRHILEVKPLGSAGALW